MSICIRCGSQTTDSYCPHCGQKQNIPRLSWKTLVHDFASRIYGIDGAFPQTVVGLFKRPAHVIQEYIDGVRNKYVGPVGYYFLVFAIYILLFKILGIKVSDYLNPDTFNGVVQELVDQKYSEENIKRQQKVMETVASLIQIMPILLFPFWGWFAKLFFRSQKHHLLEHIVFMFYLHAQSLIFSMAGLLLHKITGIFFLSYDQMISIIYISISASFFYTGKLSVKGILKALLTYFLAFICYILGISVIGSVYFSLTLG